MKRLKSKSCASQRTNMTHNNGPESQADTSSYEQAKKYALKLPLQHWPKIPRDYWVTHYDVLAEYFVIYGRIFELAEHECRVVERVYGLELQFENGTARWLGTRSLLLENSHRTQVYRLLDAMCRVHARLRVSPDSVDYRERIVAAIKNLQEAFLDTTDRLAQVVVEAAGLLDTCPRLLCKPNRMLKLRKSRIVVLAPEDMLRVMDAPLPWPKGF
jgi:hypothetical protein